MKTGTFATSGSDAALISLVIPPQAFTARLSDIVQALLGDDPDGVKRLIGVDYARRRVFSSASTAGMFAAIAATLTPTGGPVSEQMTFQPSDPSKTSLVWDAIDSATGLSLLTPLGTTPVRSNLGDEVDSLIGLSAPTKSLAGLAGAVEDAILGLALLPTPDTSSGVLVIDQLSMQARLYVYPDAASVIDASAGSEAIFNQTVTSSSGAGSGIWNQ